MLSNALLPAISGALASISGVLIAAYLLISQISGRRPYSRFVVSFYSPVDFCYFLIFFGTILSAAGLLAFSPRIAHAKGFYAYDIVFTLFVASIVCLSALMVRHLMVFNYRLVAERALRTFNLRGIKRYGLVFVERIDPDRLPTFKLKDWGHRHNLKDPLGPFHDLVMEAVHTKERISFHICLNVLFGKVANLIGCPWRRQFGLAGGDQERGSPIKWGFFVPSFRPAKSIEEGVQVLVHALHYVVRRSKKMVTEWELDNHRQIFTITLADLILTLAESRRHEVLVNICLDAVLRVNWDYKQVAPFGSYEPVKDLFWLSSELGRRGFGGAAQYCLRVLAFLELNTPYLSVGRGVNLKELLESMRPELTIIYEKFRIEIQGKDLCSAFPVNIWRVTA